MKTGITIDTDNGRKPAPETVEFWAQENGVNEMAAKGLHNKLRRVFNAEYIKGQDDNIGIQQGRCDNKGYNCP